MTAAGGIIIRLTDADATELSKAGGKGSNLALLARFELPVPPAFVISTEAYRLFIRENQLGRLIDHELAQLSADHDTAEAVSERLRHAFESAPIPASLLQEISAAYATLGEGQVAVRSSATAEDLPDASFAGQQDTFLNVSGASDVCDAVRRCWSSLWTARAIIYRRRQNVGQEDIALAVVVQQMVPALAAGVLFTADPVSGRRNHIVVEATAGLGEALVSGWVTPHRWTIDAQTKQVVSESNHPDSESPPLNVDQLDGLVALGARVAETFGSPQDIEWAIDGGRCWLLQSRPITSLFHSLRRRRSRVCGFTFR